MSVKTSRKAGRGSTETYKAGNNARKSSQSEAISPPGVLNARTTNADDEKYIAKMTTITERTINDALHCIYIVRAA